tara:strand:- start:2628 stop:3059 length:432 start_codon:yes stop_codon:yes gene_type:complete
MEEEKENTDIKILIFICLVFFAAFFVSATVLIYFVRNLLLLFLASSLVGSCVSIGTFVWALGKAPTKKDQLKLARLCALLIVLAQIPLIVFDQEKTDLISSGIYGVLFILVSGGMTLLIYYGFLRVSFDFLGALARRNLVSKE